MKLRSGALLASLACLLVAPDAAFAGCSSRFMPANSHPSGSGIGLETLDLAGELAAADLGKAPREPKPCTGAMCSSRPAVPISPAPSQVLRLGLWAILEIAPVIATPEPPHLRRDEGEACPIRCITPIFHPPRPSPSHHIS